jgi:hypothetical protein
MQKYIIEVFSRFSMADAAAQAMAQASLYLSEHHDICIAVLEMAAVRGRGYKVVLEVTLIPLSDGESVQSESQDVEPKQVAAAAQRARREADDTAVKRRVVEHFRRRRGTFIDTPTIHLAQLTEDMLLGQITTEFMPKAQPVNLGPLHDPLAVQKSPPAAAAATEEAVQEFQQATRPEPDPPDAGTERTPGGKPIADPD